MVNTRDRWRLYGFVVMLLVSLVLVLLSPAADYLVLGVCLVFPAYLLLAHHREKHRRRADRKRPS